MRAFITFLFIWIQTFEVFSQKTSPLKSNSTFGLNLGTATYYGDLSPYRYPFRGMVKSTSFHGNIEYSTEINEKWGRSIKLQVSELRGDDNRYNLNASPVLSTNLIRNLHFRNRIFQLSYFWRYYLSENQATITRHRNNWNPYLTWGVGLIYNNPQARSPFETQKGDWVNLRPLHTTSSKLKYLPLWINVPVGIGVVKKVNRKWDFKAQAHLNLPFTDYLDDVSEGKYLSSTAFDDSKAYTFHNRIFESKDPLTGQDRAAVLAANNITLPDAQEINKIDRGTRNSIFSMYDLFITTEVGFHYWLDWKIR